MICYEDLSFGPAPYFIFGLSQKRARKGHNRLHPLRTTQTALDDLIRFNPCLNPYFWRVRVMWIIFWRNLVQATLAVSWVIVNCLSLSTFLHLPPSLRPVRGHNPAAHPSFHGGSICIFIRLTRQLCCQLWSPVPMSALMHGTGSWFGLSFNWQSGPTDRARTALEGGHNEK